MKRKLSLFVLMAALCGLGFVMAGCNDNSSTPAATNAPPSTNVPPPAH